MFVDQLIPISDRNLVLSDLFIVIGNIIWMVKAPKVWITYVNPFRPINRAIWIMALAGVLSALTEVGNKSDFYSMLGALQISFIACFLNPLVSLECRDQRTKWKSLLLISMMLGLAGGLSISEKIGITAIGSGHYYRIVNPMIGVNRFYLVGILSIFILMAIAVQVSNKKWFHVIFVSLFGVFGLAGLYLAQVRSGYILLALSLVFFFALVSFVSGLRLFFKDVYNKSIAIIVISIITFSVLAVTVLGSSQWIGDKTILTEERGGLLADDSRTELVGHAFNSYISNPTGFGIGLGKGKIDLGSGVPQNVHNVYIQSFYEMGVVGGLAIFALFFELSVSALTQLKHISADSRTLINRNFFAVKAKNGLDRNYVMRIVVGISSVWIIIGTLFVVFNVYPIGYLRIDWVVLLIGAQTISCRKCLADNWSV